MFSIFSNAMKAATRLDTWDTPQHWRNQHDDYRPRESHADAERVRLRRMLSDTGLR